MQWGDLSYTSDQVSEFLSNKNSFAFKNRIPSLTQLRRNGRESHESKKIDSRQMKMFTLMEIYERERSS